MVLGNKLGEKSRRERRKEARLLKKKKKFDSWTQHQMYHKLKKCSMDSNPVNVMKSKNPFTQSLEKREVLETDIDSKSHHSSEKLSMLKKIENRLDSSRFPNSTASKTIEGRKILKKSKSKFKDYLAMEMQHDAIPVEDDLEMERRLAKKLKVKDGKLGGVDDDINMLFEGIPSVIDFFKEEGNPVSVVKRSENNSSSKKRKKRKSLEKGLEHCSDMTGRAVAMASDTDVVVSEPVETSGTKLEPEQVSANLPDLNGNGKYIAPHLRSRMQNESEEYSQIRRRVRGLLNRLSESNVESITDEMSTIFRSVTRSVGSMIITGEVLASCSGGPRGNEQYAAVFAAFVAGMASVVGIDFGAKFLASLAKCFEEEYLEEDNLSLRNLTLLLSYLYVFGVCSSDLIYDFMIMLSKRLTEIDVCTILTILQCCGMNLRGEDHAAMKSFVLSVRNRANELRGSSGSGLPNSSSKRMEFMLETITDIKNNKKRAKGDTPQHTRMKKWLQKLRVEDIKILGLKWSKLLDPDKKGQWWLSGDIVTLVSSVEGVERAIEKETLEAQTLLQLASEERMNTDVRRSIFCVIMGAEDYIDAFDKLLRLNLRGKQDRDIMRVLVQCCLHEQLYNKYYPILAIRLCSHDNNHKATLKYCLWDHFKELESLELKRSMHLSKFVCDMFATFTLSLSVLKVVDFTNARQMVPRRIKHFQLIFESLLDHPDTLVWNIFSRISANPDCESLRRGIEFFINKYVVSRKDSLANKAKIVKKALVSVEGEGFMGS